MTQEDLFLKNLERWKTSNLQATNLLETFDTKEFEVCRNDDGDLNLKTRTTPPLYFHSSISPEREARQWFLNLNLYGVRVLYVFGIGLGYYYDVVKAWLKEDSNRFVVFLEDNLEVIHRFLETERASDFLLNSQVRLYHFNIKSSFMTFSVITSIFSLMPFTVTALKFYYKTRSTDLTEIYSSISYFYGLRMGSASEYLGYGSIFFGNFYKNLLLLPNSKLESKMVKQFEGVPAIICGAGPSLGKNIEFLKTLQNKALIMAGGTAMNVLNGAGIRPHFGIGIDPNPAHFNRLISNTAFEEPFFYRQRMYHPALKIVHGERIFISGASGYNFPEMIEKKLGVESANFVEEGHNVVNFNLGIAKDLGCNPILIVGVDLAYSNDNSYAPGLTRHAIHEPKDAFTTKSSNEELLRKNDIYGKPVHTLWKWVNESLWFTQFAEDNPGITLLNCTQGGIGFSKVPNLDLEEAANTYLKESYDFSSYIHGTLQNSDVPPDLTLEKILENYESIAKSLLNSEKLINQVLLAYTEVLKKYSNAEPPKEVNTPEINEYLDVLEAENVYKYLLENYKSNYLELLFPHFKEIDIDSRFNTEKEIWIKKITFELGLYNFLAKVVRQNMNILASVLNECINESKKPPIKPLKRTLEMQGRLLEERTKASELDRYEYDENSLTMIDSELGLNYSMKCDCKRKENHYSDGTLKTIVHRNNNVLHGPSFFYASNGQVVSKNWYLNGQLEGKGWSYYRTGELYAIRRYKNDQSEGVQEYYYKSGLPKSVLPYKNGLLEGQVFLYHPNGKVKRQIHFTNGKKNGSEYFWNEDGILLIEANYEHDIPVGVAREWNANGNLAKEITYQKDTNEFEIKTWDSQGRPIRKSETRNIDYFDRVTIKTTSLTDSIKTMYQSLVNMAPAIKADDSAKFTSIEEDLLALKVQMDKLTQYGNEMEVHLGHQGANPKEAVWKTPEVERILRAQLDAATTEISFVIKETSESLKLMMEKFEQMNKFPPDSDNKKTKHEENS